MELTYDEKDKKTIDNCQKIVNSEKRRTCKRLIKRMNLLVSKDQ